MKYNFCDCQLDIDTGELTRNNRHVKLEPQVYDLLVLLLSHHGRLVSYEHLLKSVWKGRVVSDSAIASRISAARAAIGDNGKDQKIIVTVSKKGFKLIATVKEINEQCDNQILKIDSGDSAKSKATGQKIRFCYSKDGTRIAYAESGKGKALVKVGHWLTHLQHDWTSPIWEPFLKALNHSYRLFRYDQRGNGLSDWEIEDFSHDRFVDDLEAVVNSANLDRFILYATSQGVPAAIRYILKNPNRVSHLVLHGGYVQGRLVRNNVSEVERGEAILTLIKHGWGQPDSPFLKSFSTMYIPDGSASQIASLAELQKMTTTPSNAVAIRRAADTFDITGDLENINTRTLVIHARNDGVHPLEEGIRLAAGIKNSQFVLLESSNHALLDQEPAWHDFFRELDRFTADV